MISKKAMMPDWLLKVLIGLILIVVAFIIIVIFSGQAANWLKYLAGLLRI